MAKQIHERVAPVVTWLRTAEEESSDEDEDDDVEVVYTEKASETKMVTETVDEGPAVSHVTSQRHSVNNESFFVLFMLQDDFDIDAI